MATENGNASAGTPSTWRVSEEVGAALLRAQPALEKLIGLSLSRNQLIDYCCKKGLEALGLAAEQPSPAADDPLERR